MDWNAKGVRASLLLVLTLIAYAPALRGGFVWDDDAHVTNNPTLTSLDGLRRIWMEPEALPQYYPLVHTTFWIERHLFELNPLGYHLDNVLLHLVNALLLWFLLDGLRVRGAWLAAAVFALHPVQVESVAWITERKNVLSALFYLLSGACFLRFYDLIEIPVGVGRARRWPWYASGFALFVGALLSKTVTATLPLALLIVLWWKRDRVRGSELLPLVPPLLVGVAFGLVTVWLEKHHVGAEGDAWTLSPVDRVLLAGRALWFYAGKLAWPSALSFFYPRWRIDAGTAGQYLFPLAAVATGAALLVARRQIGKGPFAAAAFFAVTLFPALGFFDVYPMRFSWVADHFQYLACAGLIALAPATAARALGRIGALGAQAGRAGAGVVLVVLCILSWRQSGIYKDAETLWRDTIAKNPGSWTPHNNLGVLLMQRGEAEEAIREYADAARLSPDSWMPHKNLGLAYRQGGQRSNAIREYSDALRINPEISDAHLELANLLAESGSTDAAIAQFEEAGRRDPNNAAIPFDLGLTLLDAGRAAASIGQFESALRRDPAHVEARTALGNALASLGRTGEAIEQYTEALRRNPDAAETHNNLANALAKFGKNAEAIEHYRDALRVKPDYVEAADNLGLLLTQLNRLPEAIESFQLALRIRPDFPEAHNNLGVVLANSNRLPEAIEQFEQAVKLKPDFTSAQRNLDAVRRMASAPASRSR
jgi:tetratricopeptide (TPR) repeat protein